MKRVNPRTPHLSNFSSGTRFGGKVSRFRGNQRIYKQGAQAPTLFYIQEGAVRLTVRSKNQFSAVTSILGVGDFFGELCLSGYARRMSSAVALSASSIRIIQKQTMLQILRKTNNKTSNAMVAYLLSSVKTYRDHVVELLTFSAEQRLASVLLRLAHLNKGRQAVVEIPNVSQQVLADMVGTTRPRVNLFMNKFRTQGFIYYRGQGLANYDGGLEVHQSLRKVLRRK